MEPPTTIYPWQTTSSPQALRAQPTRFEVVKRNIANVWQGLKKPKMSKPAQSTKRNPLLLRVRRLFKKKERTAYYRRCSIIMTRESALEPLLRSTAVRASMIGLDFDANRVSGNPQHARRASRFRVEKAGRQQDIKRRRKGSTCQISDNPITPSFRSERRRPNSFISSHRRFSNITSPPSSREISVYDSTKDYGAPPNIPAKSRNRAASSPWGGSGQSDMKPNGLFDMTVHRVGEGRGRVGLQGREEAALAAQEKERAERRRQANERGPAGHQYPTIDPDDDPDLLYYDLPRLTPEQYQAQADINAYYNRLQEEAKVRTRRLQLGLDPGPNPCTPSGPSGTSQGRGRGRLPPPVPPHSTVVSTRTPHSTPYSTPHSYPHPHSFTRSAASARSGSGGGNYGTYSGSGPSAPGSSPLTRFRSRPHAGTGAGTGTGTGTRIAIPAGPATGPATGPFSTPTRRNVTNPEYQNPNSSPEHRRRFHPHPHPQVAIPVTPVHQTRHNWNTPRYQDHHLPRSLGQAQPQAQAQFQPPTFVRSCSESPSTSASRFQFQVPPANDHLFSPTSSVFSPDRTRRYGAFVEALLEALPGVPELQSTTTAQSEAETNFTEAETAVEQSDTSSQGQLYTFREESHYQHHVPHFQLVVDFATRRANFDGTISSTIMASSTRLQVQGTSSMTETKQRAQEDAQKMQSAVNELCANTGRPQPRYELLELIGKGSFGRVYLGEHKQTKALVAIKVLNIEEADIVNPRGSDAFGDIRKEIMALQTLRDHKAKNINVIMEAENWGSTVWLVTEYCSGGSIQTLMKPTSPNGLAEQWVIPIVREVAEAIMWVHRVGLVHRDIKAANVLITEQGSLQLCDFGVAGIVEGKLDKRTTIIGTPHWMAPELLLAPPGATYGKEVDIWAFGSLIYECATGYPPNVGKPLSSMEALGRSMQKPEDAPRLEDDRYSDNLKDIVAFCLQSDIEKRPKIEAVQKHSYIANTESQYPTATLASLVVAYKAWTDQGGYRKSLFQSGGVQEDVSGLAAPVYGDDWNFSTTATFDAQVSQLAPSLDIDGVYAGNALDLRDETVRPQKAGRRRPPPEALARVPPPLAKVFDPNTMSNYNTSSKVHYNAAPQQYNSLPPDLYEPPSNNQRSDLPLRNNTGRTSTRESMIDLGGHDMETGISSFADTIKPGNRQPSEDDDHSDFHRPALSDPADTNPNRRTQDWKFPSMAPASADPEVSRFPASSYELPRPAVTPAAGGRPALMHHPTEPLPNMDRQSVASLIDLDMGMPDPYPVTRPSTANSDVGSATSEHVNTGNPFEFERHASYVAPNNYEPSIYLEESNPIQFDRDSRIDLDMALDTSGPRDVGELSDFSEAETAVQSGEYDNVEYLHVGPPPNENQRQNYTFDHFPPLGPPPSAAALAGTASRDEMLSEIDRLLGGFRGQLEAFRDVYDSPAVRSRSSASNNSNNRRR